MKDKATDSTTAPALLFREEVRPEDASRVEAIVSSTGFFSREEIDIAVELVTEHLARGTASGYFFLFAEAGGEVVGYTCFGPIPATLASFDLYWIAVENRSRRAGIGRALLARTEEAIALMGGTQLFIDTSARPQYAPTRAFYERCGFREAAFLPDFYSPGDGKIIYSKKVQGTKQQLDLI